MTLDLTKIPPATRKALIQNGKRFSSSETLGQANKTLNALATHAAKLEDHGFGPDDVIDLKGARDALIAAGVSREDKRVDKKTTNQTYTDAMREAQQGRLRARSVLKAAGRVLAQTAGDPAEEAVRSIDALLSKGSVAGDDAEKLSTQLDQLRAALEDSVIKPAVATRGGPKAVTELKTQADALRAASQTTAAPRGTPQETEQLDLLDGIILSLVRSAREAADAASKSLGEPALVAEFELTELYAAGRAKTKTSEETSAPGAPEHRIDTASAAADPTGTPAGALPGDGAE
ncbi:MAG TPA: hypothetical protein VE093_04575 [Polyangiaceae bacterium]|jgi:hypothetical protein|nr:hypothetical protein [Polyangiaceae bacterium]